MLFVVNYINAFAVQLGSEMALESFISIFALAFTLCNVKLTIADIYWTFTMCHTLLLSLVSW